MTRKREKETVIPGFDPAELARELEANERPTVPPPSANFYARIVEGHVDRALEDKHDTPRTMTAATPPHDPTMLIEDEETLGREMYGSYLRSDFPDALVLAERVLEKSPEHALAQLVAERCRALLGSTSDRCVQPSSVLRLKAPAHEIGRLGLDPTSRFVLGHIDGVTDAETISKLLGVPPKETLDRLHALLELGVVELVA